MKGIERDGMDTLKRIVAAVLWTVAAIYLTAEILLTVITGD
jgi:hypothetical protein